MPFHKLIAQNILWRGLYFFSQFLLNILISRYFKAEGIGAIYYVVNNLSLLLLINSLCIESGAAFYVSKKEISYEKIAFFCVCWSLVGTMISLFFFKVTAGDSLTIFSGKTEYIAGIACYALGVLLTTYFSALYFARQDFFLPNFLLFLVNLVLSILLIYFGTHPLIKQHFVLIYFASFLLQGFILAIIFFLKNVSPSAIGFLTGHELSKLFRYSLLALLSNIIFFLCYRVDYWFVKKFCSENDMGNYIQVSKLCQMFFVLPGILAGIIFPFTAGGQRSEVQKNLKLIMLGIFFLYAGVCLILAITGKWLFVSLYGKSFDNMYLPFLLSIPGILSLSMLYPFSAYYAGKKRLDINIKGALIALVFIISGDLLFIPHYGIAGAALVSSAGYMVYQCYVMILFTREYQVSLLSFFSISRSELTKAGSIIFSNIFNKNRHE